MFIADGWTTAGGVVVWQIALFISLGESYAAFGGAMALAGVVGAVGGFTGPDSWRYTSRTATRQPGLSGIARWP